MKILLFGLAVAFIALYLLTQNRKIEFEFEIEPKDGSGEKEDE